MSNTKKPSREICKSIFGYKIQFFFFTLYILEKFCGQLKVNSDADAILFVYILTLLNFANSFKDCTAFLDYERST